MAMIAIGKKGPKDNLPQQLQEREYPSDRKPLAEIVMEGQFKRYGDLIWNYFCCSNNMLPLDLLLTLCKAALGLCCR
jgi:hypothetical protein